MYGQIQYVSDTLLVDKILTIDAVLSKTAGVGDFLGGIASSISDWAKQNIHAGSLTEFLGSMANLLVPGVLFKIHPALGVLATAASVFGFDYTSIIHKIMAMIKGKAESGEEITLNDVNQAGKEAVAAEAGSDSLDASAEFFDDLYQLEKRGRLLATADLFDDYLGYRSKVKSAPPATQTMPKIPFFGGGDSILEKIFGQLFMRRKTGKAKWLIGGFVVWIIKTILLSVGLIAAGEGIKKLLSPHQETKETPANQFVSHDQTASPESEQEQEQEINLTPTGLGQDLHTNDDKTSSWYVPVIGGTIENMLLNWAGYVYADLKDKKQEILRSPSFNKTVQELRVNFEPGASNLRIPSKFKSIKQVVDQFAKDVK